MNLCQLNNDMKVALKDKLLEISEQVNTSINSLDNKEKCLLCDIRNIKELASELDKITTFYHFQSSLLPHIVGLDEISKALTVLAVKHHGALIAIEKSDSLATFANNGVYIGAKLTASLLQTIFYPGNPMHDGAVIIRDGQIVSAGCVFPLTEQKYAQPGRKVGTRHRAAVGLSERKDALVIVVSEETGEVSFSLKGILYPIELSMCPNLQKPEVKLQN